MNFQVKSLINPKPHAVDRVVVLCGNNQMHNATIREGFVSYTYICMYVWVIFELLLTFYNHHFTYI